MSCRVSPPSESSHDTTRFLHSRTRRPTPGRPASSLGAFSSQVVPGLARGWPENKRRGLGLVYQGALSTPDTDTYNTDTHRHRHPRPRSDVAAWRRTRRDYNRRLPLPHYLLITACGVEGGGASWTGCHPVRGDTPFRHVIWWKYAGDIVDQLACLSETVVVT